MGAEGYCGGELTACDPLQLAGETPAKRSRAVEPDSCVCDRYEAAAQLAHRDEHREQWKIWSLIEIGEEGFRAV